MKEVFIDLASKKYNTVTIGNQIWMAENLNYIVENSMPSLFGRLYNWKSANMYCPKNSGWHLPGHADWALLMKEVGGPIIAGMKLKSVEFNGTDNFGFSAKLGGYIGIDGNICEEGNAGKWWCTAIDTGLPYCWHMERNSNALEWDDNIFSDCLLSVRYVKNK